MTVNHDVFHYILVESLETWEFRGLTYCYLVRVKYYFAYLLFAILDLRRERGHNDGLQPHEHEHEFHRNDDYHRNDDFHRGEDYHRAEDYHHENPRPHHEESDWAARRSRYWNRNW